MFVVPLQSMPGADGIDAVTDPSTYMDKALEYLIETTARLLPHSVSLCDN